MEIILIGLAVFIVLGSLLMFLSRDPNKKGMGLLEKGDYRNAVAKFERVLAKNPKNWEAYGYLGDTYRRLGRYEKAIDSYKTSLSYNPEAIDSYEGLALSYVDKGFRFNEAIVLLGQTRDILKDDALLLNETRIFYLEALSWVYFQKGDTARAMKYFDEAYPLWQKDFQNGLNEFDPYFSEVHYRFGVLLNHRGEKEKARGEFEKAVRCAPMSIFAKKSQEEIEKLK